MMRVLIVDDDKLVCASLKIILEADSGLCVIGLGHSGEEAVALYETLLPDILLMDIRMEGKSGLTAGREILLSHPDAKILFLTTFLDDEYIVRALKLGAKGYLLKQNFESILPALKAVSTGQTVFGSEIVGKLPALMNRRQEKDLSAAGLTPKEAELTELVAQGLSNREIAKTMFFSEGTVRNYLSTILEKLGLRDRTQLAIFYYDRGE